MIPRHKIDAHVHIMTPKRVRGGIRWVRPVAPDYENLSLDVTTEDLVNHLREEGIDFFFNFFYPLRPHESREINLWQRRFADQYQDCVPFASLHPGDEDKSLIIKEALDSLHLAGFKFHPYVQGFHLMDNRMLKVYEELDERKAVVVIHTGFSSFYRLPSMTEECMEFMARYQHMRVVLAHFLFTDLPLSQWPKLLETHPNVYLDVTNVIAFCTPGSPQGEELQELLAICSQRMVFGSDFPMGMLYPTGKLHRIAEAISPDQKSLDDLMWRTAASLVGLALS